MVLKLFSKSLKQKISFYVPALQKQLFEITSWLSESKKCQLLFFKKFENKITNLMNIGSQLLGVLLMR